MIIVISNPINFIGEIYAVIALFQNGLSHFHLRKPNLSVEETASYIEKIPKEFHQRIVLHNYPHLLKAYSLKGVHFSSYLPAEVYFNQKATFCQSQSFHSLEEIRNNKLNFDYVFLSPVYDSISKIGYCSSFNHNDLSKQLKNIKNKIKIIALGGINENNISNVSNLGFDGAAVLGSIWNNTENLPHEKLESIVLSRYEKVIENYNISLSWQ